MMERLWFWLLFWLLFAIIVVSAVIDIIMQNVSDVFAWCIALFWMLMFRSAGKMNDMLWGYIKMWERELEGGSEAGK